MKNIFKYIIFLFIILISVNFSHSIFAQEKTVNFDINSSSVDTSSKGYFYYNLDGWWEPDSNGVYYLILKYGNNKVDLCNFSVTTGAEHFKLKYPTCNGMTSGYVVNSDNQYSVYFSNSSKGKPISTCYSSGGDYCLLDSVPKSAVVNEHDVFENWSVNLKKQGNNNYYYDISADVIDGETGKVEIVLKRTDKTGEIMVLNSDFNLSVNNTISATTKNRTPVLKSGEYKITINYKDSQFELPIQTYIIGTKVPNSGGGSNNWNNSTTGVGSNSGGGINDGDGLVSTKCGYNNGPMCGFSDFMGMLNRIINYIFVLVLPISAIMFTYAGFLYISSAADPKKRTAAKNAMTKLVIGVIIIMLAWIIVKTILITLGVQKGFSFLGMRN